MKRVRIEIEDEHGFVYVLPSLVFAREYLGISRNTMEAVCDKGIRVHGFLVRTSSSRQTNEKDLPRQWGEVARRRLREEVVAWREGQAVKFPSVTDAARTAGCREVTIRQAMRREAKAGGWRWTKADEYEGESEDWVPGMPLIFKFKLNAKIDGRLVEEKKSDKDEYGESLEQKEWRRHGCSNNEEWHDYLNKCLWENEMTPPLADINNDDYGIF